MDGNAYQQAALFQHLLNDIVLARTEGNLAPFDVAIATDKSNKFLNTVFCTVRAWRPAPILVRHIHSVDCLVGVP